VTDLLVRDFPETPARSLRSRASRHRRSVQGEAATILSEEAQRSHRSEFRRAADEIYESLRGRHFTDSALLIREDRDSDYGRDTFRYTMSEFRDALDRLRPRFAGRTFDDSADITRLDRDTDHGRQ
jgi:plasmid stability protein